MWRSLPRLGQVSRPDPAAWLTRFEELDQAWHHRLWQGSIRDVLARERRLVHVGAHVAGVDRADPQPRFLDGEDFGELVLGSLGRPVTAPAPVAFDGGVGTDQHHAASVIRGS